MQGPPGVSGLPGQLGEAGRPGSPGRDGEPGGKGDMVSYYWKCLKYCWPLSKFSGP